MPDPAAPPHVDLPPAATDEPVWLRRLTAAAEVVLCSGLPTQLALAALFASAGLVTPPRDGAPLALPFVATLLLADTVVVIALMVAFLRARGESPRTLWLGSRAPWREAWLGLTLVPAIVLVVAAVLLTLRFVAPWLHNVPANPFEALASGSPMHTALFGLIAIVAGGVREELQRAFLLHRFEHHLGGATVGVIVLSLAFGLGHIDQGRDAVLATALLGLFWAVLYLRRRSSVAPIVSHAGFNALEVLRVAVSP